MAGLADHQKRVPARSRGHAAWADLVRGSSPTTRINMIVDWKRQLIKSSLSLSTLKFGRYSAVRFNFFVAQGQDFQCFVVGVASKNLCLGVRVCLVFFFQLDGRLSDGGVFRIVGQLVDYQKRAPARRRGHAAWADLCVGYQSPTTS